MRRDIAIITERAHLSADRYPDGFGLKNPQMYNKADRLVFRDRFNKQWNAFENISGKRFRAASNRNRQRKKGPIVRFGGRVYK